MRDIRGRRLAAAALSSAWLCGCVSEKPMPLPRSAPAAFEHGSAGGNGIWPSQDWYRGFGSEELDSFVDLAARNNTDLAEAGERVAQADARAQQARAAILPNVAGNASGNYFAGHSQQGAGHELDWFAMISASYEVDFWGRNRATARAAQLQAAASRADCDTIELTILAGVAGEYFQVLALREREDVARLNREAGHKVLDAVQARF